MTYQTQLQLEQSHAQLHNSVRLHSGMEMAQWSNHLDRIRVLSNHHTLSLYVHEGYETYQKTPHGWKNGGAPNRFCLMPQHLETQWDIRGQFGFVHLYFTDSHLREVASQVWDKEPNSLLLNDISFGDDERISALYRLFLLESDWHDSAQRLSISTATTLLLNQLVQHHCNVNWRAPSTKGGLAPSVLRLVLDYIHAHLQDALSIEELARVAHLSPYHFAHMFSVSMRASPHQYVLQQRLNRAKHLIEHSQDSLINVALHCGFANASHFSRCFKRQFGSAPSHWRGNG